MAPATNMAITGTINHDNTVNNKDIKGAVDMDFQVVQQKRSTFLPPPFQQHPEGQRSANNAPRSNSLESSTILKSF